MLNIKKAPSPDEAKKERKNKESKTKHHKHVPALAYNEVLL